MLFFSGCTSFQVYLPPTKEVADSTNPENLQAKLQLILDEAVNEFHLPGLQAGLCLPGGRTVLAASGTPDYGRKRPRIADDTMFRIGSTTKLFVAALICRLAERGRLSLDDGVDRWFPGQDWAKNLTIRDLLQQTSGIAESLFTDPGILMQSMLFGSTFWDPAKVAKTIMRNARLAAPGDRHFVYANNNYLLLGLIAEQVGHQGLARQLSSEFFEPLGMTNTCLLPYDQAVAVNLATGIDEYIPFGPHLLDAKTTAWDSLTFAAGAMASTASDLLKWLDALFHGRVLQPASLAAMQVWVDARNNGRDNDITGYGLGLARYELGERQLLGHPGGGFGGECFPFYWAERDVSVVVAYNLSRKDNPAGKAVLDRILDLIEATGSQP